MFSSDTVRPATPGGEAMMPREIPRRLLLHHGRIGENRGEIGKHVPGREDGRGLAAPGAPVAPSPASILKEMKGLRPMWVMGAKCGGALGPGHRCARNGDCRGQAAGRAP